MAGTGGRSRVGFLRPLQAHSLPGLYPHPQTPSSSPRKLKPEQKRSICYIQIKNTPEAGKPPSQQRRTASKLICYIPFLLSLYPHPPDSIFFPNEKLNPEQEDLLHPKGKHDENHRRRKKNSFERLAATPPSLFLFP
jgi:hypothetical protein